MAWIVTGALNPITPWTSASADVRKGEIYGPLPCKRWAPRTGERHKVRHSSRVTKVAPCSTKEYTADRAVVYARWLAQRDGVAIPEDAKASCVWSSVMIPGKKDADRVRAVVWDVQELQRVQVGAGRGRYESRQWVSVRVAAVEIPHWDWVPADPVETFEDDATAWVNSLAPEQYSRLLDIAHGPVPANIAAMSDEDLLAELTS